MRTSLVSLALIAIALAAIVGGYMSGRAGAHPPRLVDLHPSSAPPMRPVRGDASDAAVRDLFSRDDVVVGRRMPRSATWHEPQLALVVGLCGESAVLDVQFLRLDVPVALDVDPDGPDAVATVTYARDARAPVLIHLDAPPSAEQLRALRARFGTFAGIASRNAAGMAAALAGRDLLYFDERGTARPQQFEARGVPLLSRDTTVDDRSSRSYVRFMLSRAAVRSAREGPLVVLVRPLPNSLAALRAFAGTRSTEFVTLTQAR